MEVIGLIPAAGNGSRLAPIPCSKELFPIGFEPHPVQGTPHPKVVSQYLMEHMQRAGASTVYFVLRNGKWDIPAYYGDGSRLGLSIAYLMMNLPFGTPFSLDQAYPFVRDRRVVFGFPDILFTPQNAFSQLLRRQEQTNSDIVLGLFKVPHPEKWDMVELTADGTVTRILPKPGATSLVYGWSIACWGTRFTAFMHEHLLQVHRQMLEQADKRELSVGAVLQAAIQNGLQVQSVCFDQGHCLDVGTPEDLLQAIRNNI